MTLRNNIIANYAGRAYSIGASYLFIPVYVQILGPEAYGLIAFYTILLTVAALADVGLSATFSREAARQAEKRNLIHLLSAAERVLLIAVGLCSISVVVTADWLAAHWLNPERLEVTAAAGALRLMALMLVPHLLTTLYSAGLLGLQRQVLANLLQALFVTLRSGLVILPILLWPDLTVFFGWQLGATILSMLLARAVLVRAMGFRSFAVARFDLSALRPHVDYAGGMLAITIIAAINTQLDKLLISRFFPLADFGYYSLASMLAQLPIAIGTPIAIALFPKLTSDIAKGRIDHTADNYERFGRLIVFVSSLAALGLALFSREILVLWLGESSFPAILPHIATVLALGAMFYCFVLSPFYLSLAHGRNRLIVTTATLTLIFSIPLTVFAIVRFGLLGAASIWFLLNFVNFLVVSAAVNRRHYPGSHLAWTGRFVLVPVLVALVPLVFARVAAHSLGASPLLTLLIGAASVALGVALFVALRLLPRDRPVSALDAAGTA